MSKDEDLTPAGQDDDNGPDDGTLWSASLHHACCLGRDSVARDLIDQGVSVNLEDGFGLTPLHYACKKSYVLGPLQDAGKNRYGEPFYKKLSENICISGYPSIVKMLVDGGADVNQSDIRGSTIFHYACEIGNEAIVKTFVRAGANVSIEDSDGSTPLHHAIINGNMPIGSILIDEGSDINHVNDKGRTPFHLACEQGKMEAGQSLFEKGTEFHSMYD